VGAGESFSRDPFRIAILVGVDLDGNLLTRLVAAAAQVPGAVEIAEEHLPGLPVGGFTGEVLEGIGDHLVDHALIGVGVVPPIAGLAVPACRAGRMDPDDPAGVDAFTDAYGVVGRVGRREVRLTDDTDAEGQTKGHGGQREHDQRGG
jgi:hypothetical protein